MTDLRVIQPDRPAPRDWTSAERGQLVRTHRLLCRLYGDLEMEWGVSDQNAPWVSFVDAHSQDVIAHCARLNDRIAIEFPSCDLIYSGRTLPEVIARIAAGVPDISIAKPEQDRLSRHFRSAQTLSIGAFIAALVTAWDIVKPKDRSQNKANDRQASAENAQGKTAQISAQSASTAKNSDKSILDPLVYLVQSTFAFFMLTSWTQAKPWVVETEHDQAPVLASAELAPETAPAPDLKNMETPVEPASASVEPPSAEPIAEPKVALSANPQTLVSVPDIQESPGLEETAVPSPAPQTSEAVTAAAPVAQTDAEQDAGAEAHTEETAPSNIQGGLTITGSSGNDQLVGTTGHDLILGGDGDDQLIGGGGNDQLEGGSGDDILLGQHGDDTLLGGEGDDQLDGGAGDDLLLGQQGDDTLLGGNGDDQLDGGAGEDFLVGGQGDDLIDGGAGFDTLLGEEGNDTLSDGSRVTLADGGAGEDVFKFNGDYGIHIGAVNPWSELGKELGLHQRAESEDPYGVYTFAAKDADLDYWSVQEAAPAGHGAADATLRNGASLLISTEKVVGSDHADVFLGRRYKDVFEGGDGDDWIDGGGGDDVLTGGGGNDRFVIDDSGMGWALEVTGASRITVTDFEADDHFVARGVTLKLEQVAFDFDGNGTSDARATVTDDQSGEFLGTVDILDAFELLQSIDLGEAGIEA